MKIVQGPPPGDRKKDHYIPAGHIRKFTDASGLTHPYDIERNVPLEPCTPVSIGYANNWDRFKVDEVDFHVDYWGVEKPFFDLLNQTLVHGRIPTDDVNLEKIRIYVATLHSRSPTAKHRIRQGGINRARLLPHLNFCDRAKKAIQTENELLLDSVNLHAAWSVLSAEYSSSMATALRDAELLMLRSHNDVPFQLGDTPVVPTLRVDKKPNLVNPFLQNTSVLCVPLTTKFALAILGSHVLDTSLAQLASLNEASLLPFTYDDLLTVRGLIKTNEPLQLTRLGSRHLNGLQVLASSRHVFSSDGDFSLSAKHVAKHHPRARQIIKDDMDDAQTIRHMTDVLIRRGFNPLIPPYKIKGL